MKSSGNLQAATLTSGWWRSAKQRPYSTSIFYKTLTAVIQSSCLVCTRGKFSAMKSNQLSSLTFLTRSLARNNSPSKWANRFQIDRKTKFQRFRPRNRLPEKKNQKTLISTESKSSAGNLHRNTQNTWLPTSVSRFPDQNQIWKRETSPTSIFPEEKECQKSIFLKRNHRLPLTIDASSSLTLTIMIKSWCWTIRPAT